MEPGEAIEVYDGDWRVRADRIRLWADSPRGKKWDLFKVQVFSLVPEETEGGLHTYAAAARDTMVFTVTPDILRTEKMPAGGKEEKAE